MLASTRDGQVRPPTEVRMSSWTHRWRYVMSEAPVLPGVWQLKGGGFFVRARVLDPRRNKVREICGPVRDAATPADALVWLEREKEKVRVGASGQPIRIKFGDYATSLLERKIQNGDINSAKTREKWGDTLELHLFGFFGDLPMDELRRRDVEEWKDEVAAKLRRKEYAPTTANGWLSILRCIVNAYVAEYEADRNPVLGVKLFDTSRHVIYTEEQPCSLTIDEVPRFLAEMRRAYPQHHAFTVLGFGTGLRPSSLRPLRRRGRTPDLRLKDGILLVRRSHTMKDEVMEGTKTGIEHWQRLKLPGELIEVLEWHIDRLEGEALASELLFPSDTGGFRSHSCLDKPFEAVSKTIGLAKRITPRAMRRTFQDLCRAAEVKDVVARAISGHATETMQRHYSSVGDPEVQSGIARVIDLMKIREAIAA